MKEEGKPSKRWVKKCAAIFFAVLLLLTFFSNTIMNYSLPQVATQYVEAGTIASKVRGSGVVGASNPYDITATGERKVRLVAVKEGDSVEEGALLVLFEDGDSTELTDAKLAVEEAKSNYQKYIVSNEITQDLVQKAESGQSGDYSGYQTELANAKKIVDAAQEKVDSYTDTTRSLQAQIDALQNINADTTAEEEALDSANQNLTKAQSDLTIAENTATSLQEQYDLYMEAGGDVSQIAIQLANAKNTFMNAQNYLTQCQQNVEQAQNTLTAKQENTQNAKKIRNLQTQLNEQNTALTEATDALAEATESHQKILERMNTEIELAAMYQAISDAQAALDKINANGDGNKITAPASGVISNLAIAKGQTTMAGDTLMSITGGENGYIATLTVTTEQARRVKVGDTADINESWYYSDVTATVTAIRNDKENPGASKLIDLKVTGDVAEGTTLNFAIGDKNNSYNLIVPNGAIREDKNGKFILIIREKNSPLGNRYFAKRIDVEVLASDDVKTAISGDLNGYEYVITTSTKAIEPGDQVRLKES